MLPSKAFVKMSNDIRHISAGHRTTDNHSSPDADSIDLDSALQMHI